MSCTSDHNMPPRRAKSAASKSSKKATTKNAGSKEAKKLGLSAEDEASIREIFEQFGEEDEELGEIMQTSDLRQALKFACQSEICRWIFRLTTTGYSDSILTEMR